MYYVRPKYTPELDPDAIEDQEYRGETGVFVDNVPPDCGETELRAWLTEGIAQDDPEVIAAKLEIEDRKAQVVSIKDALRTEREQNSEQDDE